MATPTFLRRPAVLLALALCSVGGVVTLLGRLAGGPPVAQKRSPLSTEAGTEAYPSFSPDGQSVAYSARDASRVSAFHIYIRSLLGGAPRELTSGAGNDVGPVWSPDGNSIAFLRTEGSTARYLVVPASGGTERVITDYGSVPDESRMSPPVSWSRDGKSLAVVTAAEKQIPGITMVTLDGGVAARITHPPEGSEGDFNPVIAPDGNSVAFVRYSSSGGGDIHLCDLTGGSLRRATFDDRNIRGISWTPDGRDIVYAANRVGPTQIWRVAAFGGSPRALPLAGRQAQFPSVAPAGRRLAYADSPSVAAIWRATLNPNGEASEAHPFLRSTGRESSATFSPDGKRIANISEQTGNDEIWIADADGGNRVQVTDAKGPSIERLRWSPDSKTLLFDMTSDHGQDLYTVAATANAKPNRVVADAANGSFSQDGKRIYYQSRGQLWKSSVNGGNPEVLTPRSGGGQPVESADGKYVYFRMRRTFWRVPAQGGGQPEEVIVPDHDLLWSTTMQMTRKGLYYQEFERSSRSMVVTFYDFTTRKNSVVYRLKNTDFGSGWAFSVSPDGKYLLYPRVDQSETNLMMIENFR